MRLIEVPSAAELKTRVEAIIRRTMPSATFLSRSVWSVLRDVIAGASFLTLSFAEQAGKRAHPATSAGDDLTALAAVWGLIRKPPTAARVTIATSAAVIALLQIGGRIIVGGTQYRIVSLNNNEVVADNLNTGLLADSLLGENADLEVADAGAVAVTGFINGAEGEIDEDLRSRLQAIIRAPLSGGTAEDWRRWTLQVAGVTRAFISGGGGFVRVAFLYDNRPAPLPTVAEIAAMVLHLAAFRPAGTELSVFAPTYQTINVTISDLHIPTNFGTAAEVQGRITAAIKSYVQANAFLSDGSDTVPPSWIYDSTASVVPGSAFSVTVPALAVVIAAGKIPTIGQVEYVSSS